ncbi:hypothetical protein [Metabacillus fastidiosus]|uniref:hypothetical protein n=1 Tax=Metabacillus fastidiosus TaxID=1458 RepID=UPI003D279831
MQDSFIAALGSIIGIFVTGSFGFLAAKNQSKKDMTINDRQLLSADEKQFRNELKEMMLSYQDKVVNLTAKVEELTKANLSLETQVQSLTLRNESLEKQVQTLTQVNEELRRELQRRNRR